MPCGKLGKLDKLCEFGMGTLYSEGKGVLLFIKQYTLLSQIVTNSYFLFI